MKHPLQVYYNSRSLRLMCEIVYQSDQILRVKVWGKNREIVLQNNIPFLKANKKNGKVSWKLIEGVMHSDELLATITRELERRWKQQDSMSTEY